MTARTYIHGAMFLLVIAIAGCGGRGNGGGQGDSIDRTAEKGPVKLFVRVSPREPRLSDLLQMDVSVESQPGVEIKPPAFGQAVGDFLVRDYTERPAESGDKNKRRFHYELEPTHAGKHLIRSVAIEFADKRPGQDGKGAPTLIETEPLEVNVTSEFGEGAPDLARLAPMVPPQAVASSLALWWVAGAIGVLAVVALVLIRRRKRKPVEPPRRSPEEIAHEALSLLLAEDLPSKGLIKEFYLRLTGIVRQYVEGTTGIRAPDQTTQEFLRDIRSREVFPAERSIRLANFLESADLVKYAGQVPEEGQIEQAIARAREFVNAAPAQAEAVVLEATGAESTP
ncbi:hypothetical protein [Singulisphaera sp. PoT]|uniref:hypothetical protein n=1 Tax=Singulisphaera sp. PoT TaxID=3411797 RepID=UPI003BF56026